MALYNELLSGRFNEGLVRLFGMKQPSPAPQLAGEIGPSLDVLDLPAEYKYLFGVQLWSGNAAGPAAAAQYSGVGINNPVGSNLLLHVRKFYFDSAQRCIVTLFPGIATWTLGTVYPRDGRLVSGLYPSATAVTVVQTNNAALPAGRGLQIATAANVSGQYDTPHIVMPGQAFIIVCATVNTAVSAAFEFETRALLPSEFGI